MKGRGAPGRCNWSQSVSANSWPVPVTSQTRQPFGFQRGFGHMLLFPKRQHPKQGPGFILDSQDFQKRNCSLKAPCPGIHGLKPQLRVSGRLRRAGRGFARTQLRPSLATSPESYRAPACKLATALVSQKALRSLSLVSTLRKLRVVKS